MTFTTCACDTDAPVPGTTFADRDEALGALLEVEASRVGYFYLRDDATGAPACLAGLVLGCGCPACGSCE